MHVAVLPEFGASEVDVEALYCAALFHDGGWIVQLEQGRISAAQVLSRPTNEVQRELGAGLLVEKLGHLLPGPTLATAERAIRFCNLRDGAPVEARILSEAESLDEIGAMYVARALRQSALDGRSIEQLVTAWNRQQEYKFWESRIKESFRVETVRQLARVRLAAVDRFMAALAAEQNMSDIQRLVEVLGGQTESTSAGRR